VADAEQSLVQRITNGGDIRVGLLATTIVGGALVALFEGAAAFVLEIGALLQLVPSGLAGFATDLLGVVFGLLDRAARGAFLEAVTFTADAGLAGFVVGVGIVLTAGYGFAWVINRA
jgi:hypothetical protein